MEPMAAEQLVAALWELDGFLTKMRWPARVPGGWSDIDVVGVDATGYVRVAECKVPGSAQFVRAVDVDDVTWIEERLWSTSNLRMLWDQQDGPWWMPKRSDISQFEIWFCANIWFVSDEAHELAVRAIRRHVLETVPHGLKAKTRVELKSTLDILVSVIERLTQLGVDEGRGKRFGNPVLDVLRELARYANPRPEGAGRVATALRNETRARLLEALRLE